MVRVLVVDDSAFMRKALTNLLGKDPEIEIVGTATNGLEALDAIKAHDPDVVTLDIEMPKMDGLTALGHIMRDMPRPVLMVSSLTTEGAAVTLKALDAGAVDFVAKPSSTVSLDILDMEKELCQKVKAVAKRKRFMTLRSNMRASTAPAASTPASAFAAAKRQPLSSVAAANATGAPVCLPKGKRQMRDLVAIGVSTGGPPAVQKVLSALPADFPAPILIAQHMPAAFTGPFAARLNGLCQINVKEAENGETAKNGWAYVCPGGKHLTVKSRLGSHTLVVSEEPKTALYKPSANELMRVVGEQLGSRALGVMLTGMGSDGLEGTKVLKQRGGRAIAQNEATCVVYGMPKAIVDAGLADEILDIDAIPAAIIDNLYK